MTVIIVLIMHGLDIHLEYIPSSVSEACLSFVMAGLVVIMRPYKKIAHNVIDFLILFSLIVIGAPLLMGLVAKVILSFLWTNLLAIFCYFLLCIFYRLLKHCCCVCVARRRGNAHQVIYLVMNSKPIFLFQMSINHWSIILQHQRSH